MRTPTINENIRRGSVVYGPASNAVYLITGENPHGQFWEAVQISPVPGVCCSLIPRTMLAWMGGEVYDKILKDARTLFEDEASVDGIFALLRIKKLVELIRDPRFELQETSNGTTDSPIPGEAGSANCGPSNSAG